MAIDRPSDRVLGDLLKALQDVPAAHRDGEQVQADPGRLARKGIPEVVLAQHKTFDQIQQAVGQLLATQQRVIVSRVSDADVAELRFAFSRYEVENRPGSWTAVVAAPNARCPKLGGRVSIFAAGTSDWAAANEARVMAEEMGCHVDLVLDVGVAGLHRLFGPLRAVLDDGTDAIVVVAGMDGALPSVIAGLVPVPVIGLPVSTGYGFGGNGEAALLSMLQSCAPGLTVVNIDNAVGAGAAAAMIANSVARARH